MEKLNSGKLKNLLSSGKKKKAFIKINSPHLSATKGNSKVLLVKNI